MDVIEMARRAKDVSRKLMGLSRAVKDRALLDMAEAIEGGADDLKAANSRDIQSAREGGLSEALVDRLLLNDKRIKGMAEAIRVVAGLEDPVGEVTRMWRRPNGLRIGRMRVPIGVIGVIYESRPNVTADVASLCLKSGNAAILRGGSEAIHSNTAIANLLRGALSSNGIPEDAIQLVPSTERSVVQEMLKLDEYIDLIIPRGGKGLIRMVAENSRIPVIRHEEGICHTYVDEGADLDMAVEICYNAKVQRPSVCNAMETMLVHKDVASEFLPRICRRLEGAGVELRGCQRSRQIFEMKEATEEDWRTEYLDLILSIRVVDSMDEAIHHINYYGSHHSDAIVTRDYRRAERFLQEVDSAAVYVNASTRFTDGGEFGFGAEVGISTNRLHSRGPMGLEDLTTYKYIIYGDGQVRG
ncbi:MAG: glutamate-5-semialdehyde dehydrogenase [bacterium]